MLKKGKKEKEKEKDKNKLKVKSKPSKLRASLTSASLKQSQYFFTNSNSPSEADRRNDTEESESFVDGEGRWGGEKMRKVPRGEGKKGSRAVLERDNLAKPPDSLISSLITNDLQSELAPAIKSVFEQRKEKEVILSLEAYIEKRENSIETICIENYNEFIPSIQQLFTIRATVEKIKTSINQLNKDIQITGKNLTSKTRELVELRIISQNISAAIDLLKTCDYVLELVSKVHLYIGANKEEDILGVPPPLVSAPSAPSMTVPAKKNLALQATATNNTKFYPAIKILEQIQSTHLQNISEFTFGTMLGKSIPVMREWIMKRVTDEVNRWFLSIRENAGAIGAFAIQQNNEELFKELRDERKDSGFGGSSESAGSSTTSVVEAPPTATDTECSIYDRFKLTFAPLYQCFYIHQSLELGPQFTSYYKKIRKRQASLVLSGSQDLDFEKENKRYFNNIAGFFIIENTVCQTAPKLISPNFKNKLWREALNTMIEVMKEKLNKFSLPQPMAELKKYLHGFTNTMKSYGYPTEQFNDFVFPAVKEKYLTVSISVLANMFNKQYATDTYTPIVVRVESEYKTTFGTINGKMFPYKQNGGETIFPYSKVVPNCLKLIKTFILQCHQTFFLIPGAVDIGIDKQILKTTESAIRTLISTYVNFIEGQSPLLVKQAAMALINVNSFQVIYPIFETELEELKIFQGAKLNVKEPFENAIQKLEKKVLEVLETYVVQQVKKIEQTMVWVPDKPDKIAKPLVTELAEYALNSLPQQISGLNEDLCLKIYWTFYEVLLRTFKGVLTKEGKTFNKNCARGLFMDVLVLEDAAKRCPIPEVIEGFEECRQLLTLLTTDTPKEFLDDKIRPTKYPDLKNYNFMLSVMNNFAETSTIASRFNIGFFQDEHSKQMDLLKTFLRTHIK